MKKIVTILAAVLLALFVTGCAQQPGETVSVGMKYTQNGVSTEIINRGELGGEAYTSVDKKKVAKNMDYMNVAVHTVLRAVRDEAKKLGMDTKDINDFVVWSNKTYGPNTSGYYVNLIYNGEQLTVTYNERSDEFKVVCDVPGLYVEINYGYEKFTSER